MPRRFALLPAPADPPGAAIPGKRRRFLLGTWPGRILLATLVLVVGGLAGLPVPGFFMVVAVLVLAGFCAWGLLSLLRFASGRLLWSTRSKLIVSYLFIAMVPIVLLALFFFIAAVLFVNLVASHLVATEVASLSHSLEEIARTASLGLPAEDGAAAAVLGDRLQAARAIHPSLSYSLVRRGRSVAISGDVPRTLPAWWMGPGFGGMVDGEPPVLRAVWASGPDSFLALQVPVDRQLFERLEKETGIQVAPEVETRDNPLDTDDEKDKAEKGGKGLAVEVKSDDGRKVTLQGTSGFAFVAMPDRTDWATGKNTEFRPLVFSFPPFELVRHLSPGFSAGDLGSLANILVYALGAVGIVFLVVYAGALVLGLLLARSITRSVHALFLGTKRIRQGDFSGAIAVRSRDQLGELAESFNLMARGIEDLLREQVEKERLEEELRIARQIQMSLLPAQGLAPLAGVRIAALCLPAAEVGGDYYDLLPLSETRMGVLVADVSGKGTSAALYMAELKGLVLSLSRIYESPAKLLSEANRILSANMDARSFITMTYAVVDTAARTLRYARAGHNPMIHLDARTGRTRVLTPAGLGLGIDRGDRFDQILEEAEVPLVSGDIFLFFTDGLSEAMNVKAELFGEGRLRTILEEGEGLSSDDLKAMILDEIRRFVGEADQHDDMTLVILKVV
ncbi:MAG: PP2C family protein-serine/threonine phosphatase [Solirubrobacterales bacterium]